MGVHEAICAGRMPTPADVRSLRDIEALYCGECSPRKEQPVKAYTEEEVAIAAQLGVSRIDFLTARLAELGEKDGAVYFGRAEFASACEGSDTLADALAMTDEELDVAEKLAGVKMPALRAAIKRGGSTR